MSINASGAQLCTFCELYDDFIYRGENTLVVTLLHAHLLTKTPSTNKIRIARAHTHTQIHIDFNPTGTSEEFFSLVARRCDAKKKHAVIQLRFVYILFIFRKFDQLYTFY